MSKPAPVRPWTAVLSVTLALLATSCRQAGPSAVSARLPALVAPERAGASARFEAFEAGGGGLVTRPAVRLEGVAKPRAQPAGVLVTFERSGAFLEVTPAALGLPEDWRSYRILRLEARSQAGLLDLELGVIGARSRLLATRSITASAANVIDVDLTELPLAAGLRPAWRPEAVRVTARFEGAAARQVWLSALTLQGRAEPRPVVDGFGQRLAAAWPTKIRDLDDLRASAARDTAALAGWTPPPQRSRFGGWTGGPRFASTGFFRVESHSGGRAWLVDPEGHPFWSQGVTGVRTLKEVTPVHGRESFFAALPPLDGPEAVAYVDTDDRRVGGLPDPALTGRAALASSTGGVSFYRWNVLRKWGSFDLWRDRTLDRLQRWGVNTIGSFTYEPSLFQAQRVPFTRFFRTLAGGPADLPRTRGGFPDVFDPRWAAYVDLQTRTVTSAHRNDAWLIGYFVDNEPHWNELHLLSVHPGAPLRARWRTFLETRHGSLAVLRNAWGLPAASWEDVQAITQATFPRTEAAARDLRAFEALYAEMYFSTVKAALRRYAPSHLYLGCRFVRVPPDNDEIVRAAGRAVDVMSVNCYSMVPEADIFARWFQLGGRPVMIGEHHKPLLAPRHLPPDRARGLHAQDRTAYYRRFVETFAAMPFAVGAHWFQYVDQPLTGRAGNGENQLVGFVDVTDQPYPDMVEALRLTAARVYQVHAGQLAPFTDPRGPTP